jgi:hypothetical protein
LFTPDYLSNENKRKLQKLQERLEKSTDFQTRNETELLIQEIKAEAIPYTSCDLEKLSELKNQILDQMYILQGLRKAQSVEVFQVHLKNIDFQIQTKLMEKTIEEKNRMRPGEGPNAKDKLGGITQIVREGKKKKVMGRRRWTIDMEELEGHSSQE